MVGVSGNKLDLSLRGSRTGESSTDDLHTDTEDDDTGEGVSERSCDSEIASLEDLDVGKVVRGYVKSVTDVGVFIR